MLGILAVYRLGAWIPRPALTPHMLERMFDSKVVPLSA